MKNYLLAMILLFSYTVFGQFHELNVGAGYSEYYGDLNINNAGKTPFAFIADANKKNMKLAFSLGYRYNFAQYFSIGANYNNLRICGYDSDNPSTGIGSTEYYRIVRNLSFTSDINELYLDLRYEPLRNIKRWSSDKWFFSPYISAGVGAFHFNPKTQFMGQTYELQPLGTEGQGTPGYADKYSLTQLCIPVNLGLKVTDPNRKFAISLDFNYNYTFTDYLDDVSSVYANPSVFTANYSATQAALVTALANRNQSTSASEIVITSPGQIRGNPERNDHFLTGQIKFSYLFNSNKTNNYYYKCCGYK